MPSLTTTAKRNSGIILHLLEKIIIDNGIQSHWLLNVIRSDCCEPTMSWNNTFSSKFFSVFQQWSQFTLLKRVTTTSVYSVATMCSNNDPDHAGCLCNRKDATNRQTDRQTSPGLISRATACLHLKNKRVFERNSYHRHTQPICILRLNISWKLNIVRESCSDL